MACHKYVFVLFIALSAICQTLHADSRYAGKISGMKITRDKENPCKAIFEIRMTPAHKEDQQTASGEVFPDFDEERITVSGSGNTFSIILDSIGIFENGFKSKIPVDFINSIKFNDHKGSHLNPDIVYTDSGREIKSTQILLEVDSYVFYQFLEFDRSVPDTLILRFAIVKSKKTTDEKIKNTAVVDITDCDIPAARVIVDTFEKENEQKKPAVNPLLNNLSELPAQSFVTILYPLKYISPSHANNLVKHKLSLLGEISQDADNPSLLITDRCDYVMSIVRALNLVDRSVPQVEIEVKILEVAWDRNERIGFNWAGFSGNADNDHYQSGSLGTGATQFARAASGLGSLVVSRMKDEYIKRLNVQMDLLSKKGKLSLLAAPRLKVINNTQAVFHAGAKVPVFRKTSVYNSNDTTRIKNKKENHVYTSASTTMAYDYDQVTNDSDNHVNETESNIDVGVKLTVKPRITLSGEIILYLVPTVSEVAGWRSGSDIPIINTRTLTSTVKVTDGDTVMIAGLFKENELGDKSGVPGLQQIPGMGRLFRSENKTIGKTEVVFMLNIKLVD